MMFLNNQNNTKKASICGDDPMKLINLVKDLSSHESLAQVYVMSIFPNSFFFLWNVIRTYLKTGSV